MLSQSLTKPDGRITQLPHPQWDPTPHAVTYRGSTPRTLSLLAVWTLTSLLTGDTFVQSLRGPRG